MSSSTRVTESDITCVSGRFDVNATSVGPVEVFIDSAIIPADGVEFNFNFTFTDDPVFTSVSPQNVIPA